jgi:hypothetical protein
VCVCVRALACERTLRIFVNKAHTCLVCLFILGKLKICCDPLLVIYIVEALVPEAERAVDSGREEHAADVGKLEVLVAEMETALVTERDSERAQHTTELVRLEARRRQRFKAAFS